MAFYEVLEERHPDVCPHVAFVTGGAFGDRATRFVAGHDVPVVTKPVEQQDLLRVVERLAVAAPGPVPAVASVKA
jgi:hypothetical protein